MRDQNFPISLSIFAAMYYMVYVPFYLLSLLPLRVLHVFADFVYFIMYYVAKYRREIVFNNLAHAFPDKTAEERKKIAKRFYHNLTDTLFESLKAISMSKKQINKRNTGEYELLNNIIERGDNVHVFGGHQFNWEFGNLLYALHMKIPFIAVYMPLSNKSLDRIFLNMRKRFGTNMISAHIFRTTREQLFSKQYMAALAADQNPGNPANAYWMNFLNRPAPFVTGPAKGAVENKTAAVFVSQHKIKRGHYAFRLKLLSANASEFTPEQLTVLYKKELEKAIREEPSNYLWSHRRWRHAWKPEYGPVLD
jgi:KDO2-lipid IV(A) lauroyltransferase